MVHQSHRPGPCRGTRLGPARGSGSPLERTNYNLPYCNFRKRRMAGLAGRWQEHGPRAARAAGAVTRRDTVAAVLGRILAVSLVALGACYSPPQPDCGFSCRRNGECPDGYTCQSDGVCHRNGSPATVICAADARIDSPQPIDAPPADADMTPPMVFATMPMDGAMNVPTGSTVRVQFNEPVTGVTIDSFYLREDANPIVGTVTAIDPFTYVFMPAASLPGGATITVHLTSDIVDLSSNALVATMFSFETES